MIDEEFLKKTGYKDFRDMVRGEKIDAVKIMPTGLLFAELEDTVLYDIRKGSNQDYYEETEQWDTYRIITSELKKRLEIPIPKE